MTTPKPVVMLSMLSRQRHCSRQLDFVAMLLRLHDNIDNRSDGLDNTRPTLSTIRDNAPICKVHVRMRCDTAFTGCTVLPVTGVDEMTPKTPRPGTAAAIAAQIQSNVRAWNAREIDYQEFTRRQRAAWDPVVGRNRLHDRVLAALSHG
jgi:hypothetical protein